MNILQGIEAPETFCVTLNNTDDDQSASSILGRFSYAHPVFSLAGMAAQQRWQDINGPRRTWYCGAYWHNGFHEDGVFSALRVAERHGQPATGGGVNKPVHRSRIYSRLPAPSPLSAPRATAFRYRVFMPFLRSRRDSTQCCP
jgi:predicted NAD/FAD-binding protein